jgi:hypothetical protein
MNSKRTRCFSSASLRACLAKISRAAALRIVLFNSSGVNGLARKS